MPFIWKARPKIFMRNLKNTHEVGLVLKFPNWQIFILYCPIAHSFSINVEAFYVFVSNSQIVFVPILISFVQ